MPIRDPTAWMEDLNVWVDDDEIRGTAEQMEQDLLFRGSKVLSAICLSLFGIAGGAFAVVTLGTEIRSSIVSFGINLLVAVVLFGGLKPIVVRLVGRPMVWHAGFTLFWAILFGAGATLVAMVGSSWLAYGLAIGTGFFIAMVYGGVNPTSIRREDAWMGASLGFGIAATTLAVYVERNMLGSGQSLLKDIVVGAIAGGLFSVPMTILLFSLWDEAHALRKMAVLYLHNENFAPKAVSYLDNALARSPDDAELYNLRGVAWSKMDEPEKAFADWDKAAAMRPGFADPYLNRGVDHLRRAQLGEAVAALEKAIAVEPGNAMAHSNLGTALERRGELDRALEMYSKAIELKPDYATALTNRSYVQFRRGDHRAAIADADRALRLAPEHTMALVNRGHALAALGETEAAISSYQAAIDEDPSPEVHEEALRALEKLAAPQERARA